MEGVGSHPFRKAISLIGGFDEACTDFLRVPLCAHIPSLAKRYNPLETAPIPLAAQIMGSDPLLMGEMCAELFRLGAPRVDLNCGCPANRVTGRGAGSSLLKDPELLHSIAKEMVRKASGPVTAKLRAGFDDFSLFKENLLAAQSAGIAFLTLHPRTKAQIYRPPCHWHLIQEAKSILKIPVIGSGDVLTPQDAERMAKETGCDGIMVGRGAIQNPWIFHEIRAHFGYPHKKTAAAAVVDYLTFFANHIGENSVSHMKQLINYMFLSPRLIAHRDRILRLTPERTSDLLEEITPLIETMYP
jgi:nifR3 family TIM-barrel protein